MSETDATQLPPPVDAGAKARRALVIGDATAAVKLKGKLTAGGYEVLCSTPGEMARAAAEFSPAVVLFVFGAHEGEGEIIAAARRLRATAETFSLPLVFLFRADERTLRSAALNIGADDYFALATTQAETCARLDALLWRVETGRRAAPIVADQLSEADNFTLILDAIGRDAREESPGTVALIGLAGEAPRAAEAEQQSALAVAYGFLKLNLRRVDALAFYGSAILLAYLPRVDADAAQSTLTRLRAEFLAARTDLDLAAGFVSFSTDEDKVEALLEKAESALGEARSGETRERIVSAHAVDDERTLVTPSRRAVKAKKEDAARTDAAPVQQTKATPEAPVKTQAVETRRAPDEARPALAAGAARRLLLAVSDTTRMAQINSLLRSAGYEVRAAFDGQQALNLLRFERPDFVLIDYALNDMNGLEMLKRFRQQSGGRLKPSVTLLVPAAPEGLRAAALEAGARAALELPYDPAELLNVVRASNGGE
jgi:DNA-binding response OmpR family regulator